METKICAVHFKLCIIMRNPLFIMPPPWQGKGRRQKGAECLCAPNKGFNFLPTSTFTLLSWTFVMDSPTSDTPRQSLLGSINFLARSNRPRAATTSNNPSNPSDPPVLSTANPPLVTPGHRRRPPPANAAPPPQLQTSNSGLGYMLRRRRSATALPERTETRPATPSGPTHRIRLVPHLESHRSLHFEAISRDIRQGDAPLRIGRFTDRSAHSGSNGNKLAFKSKVVSRGHAEVWFDSGSVGSVSSSLYLPHLPLLVLY